MAIGKEVVLQRLTQPARSGTALVKDDSNDLAQPTRAIFVGTGGDVAVVLSDDPTASPVTFKNVANGSLLPIAVKRLMSTGTGASNIIGLI